MKFYQSLLLACTSAFEVCLPFLKSMYELTLAIKPHTFRDLKLRLKAKLLLVMLANRKKYHNNFCRMTKRSDPSQMISENRRFPPVLQLDGIIVHHRSPPHPILTHDFPWLPHLFCGTYLYQQIRSCVLPPRTQPKLPRPESQTSRGLAN